MAAESAEPVLDGGRAAVAALTGMAAGDVVFTTGSNNALNLLLSSWDGEKTVACLPGEYGPNLVVMEANGQPVSAIEKLSFDATSGILEQRQQDVRLKLTGTDFDRKAQYLLLLEDDEDGIELARYPVTIDLAIQNDFGF